MANIVIETPRLILREFVPEDLSGLYKLYEETDTRYIEPLSTDRDEERIKLESYIHYIYGFYGFGLWAVCLKDTGALIGRCGLQVVFIGEQGEYELGYMISGKHEGKGYASEAVRAILDYAFETLEAPRVVVQIHKANERSVRFAKHLGFKKLAKKLEDASDIQLFMYEL